MNADDPDEFTLKRFSKRLAEISVYRNRRPVLRLLELLVQHSGIKIATLWKIVADGSHAVSVERAGFVPAPKEEPTEYLCEIKGSHIEVFLEREPFESFDPWFIPNVADLPVDPSFNTPERIDSMRLSSSLMIPLRVDDSGFEKYFLNIYFERDDVNLESEENTIEAISLKTAAIVMSSVDQLRAEISRKFIEVSRHSVGDIETFFEEVITAIVPVAVAARRYFLFTRDDYNKSKCWQFCVSGDAHKCDEKNVHEIAKFLASANFEGPVAYWKSQLGRLGELLGEHDSILICPLRSQLEEAGSSGFIVICDALHRTAMRDHEVEITRPFSADQLITVAEICDRSASLFDIYLHEHRRQNMTNVLAHEILSPSIYVKFTAARLLRRARGIDHRSRRELENIHNTAGLQVSVCEGIFLSNQARSHSFKQKYSPTRLPIHRSFEEWRKFLYPTCENFGLEFENINIDVILPEIFMDVRALQVVFLNLCVNALKYSRDSSKETDLFRLSVTGKQVFNSELVGPWARLKELGMPKSVKNDGFLVLSFLDTGIGIPKQHTENVFEEYFRVETPASTFRSGMGLGLSMVRGIVRDHCGDVWVARNEKPTIFRVALPMFLQFESQSIIAPNGSI